MSEAWRSNLIEDGEGVRDVLRNARRIAVIGIKPESQAAAPAFYVPKYLDDAGYDVVPVPVYYPEIETILGKPVYRSLADLPEPADLVILFRRPNDVAKHAEEILAHEPAAVWMQLGIRNDAAAEQFARAGIKVVQDRCSMVEHRRM